MKVFISYAKEDVEAAERLYSDLLENGVDAWLDSKSLLPGKNWKMEIKQAILESSYFLVLLSTNSLSKRGFVQNEVKIALEILEELPLGSVFIVPVRIQSCTPKDQRLRDLQWVDLHISYEAGIKRILQVVTKSGGEVYYSIGEGASPESSMATRKGDVPGILVIGSGLAENIISIDSSIEVDSKYIETNRKYIVGRRELYLGGSGVNFSIRLAKAGHVVLPIISMGKDEFGLKLRKILSDIVRRNVNVKTARFFVESDEFLSEEISSSYTTVISSQITRTTFTPRVEGVEHFRSFVDKRILAIESAGDIRIKSVMIGHIYADSPENNHEGEITCGLIEKYKDKALIFANFGESQLKSGINFWKDILRSVTLAQFSLPELRDFFACDGRRPSLVEIINWLIENSIDTIITHDRFGVIAIFNRGYLKGKVIWGDSIAVDVVDTTGAGDAFAAGLVSSLYTKETISTDDFLEAIDVARWWAAYACTIFGSSIHSPNSGELTEFRRRNSTRKRDVELKEVQTSFLEILDRAY